MTLHKSIVFFSETYQGTWPIWLSLVPNPNRHTFLAEKNRRQEKKQLDLFDQHPEDETF